MTRSRRTPLYPLPLREGVDASAASVRVRGVAKLQHARALRARMTDAERKLWFALRDRRFANFKFRRQAPLGPYIADYVCYAARVVIEVDGGQHVESEYDAHRDSWLEAHDFVVLRFWNNDVLLNVEGVLTCLLDVLLKRTADGISRHDPSPASPLRGSAPSPTGGEGRERAS